MTVPLLLDVDGVLNCVGRRPTQESWTDWTTAMCIEKWPICHSQQMADALRELDVDIHWLTTWEDLANEWIGPLFGWEELPVLKTGYAHAAAGQIYVPNIPYEEFKYDNPTGWWKFEMAQRFYHDEVLAKGQWQMVWIDDDLATEQPARDWAKRNGILTISPYTMVAIEKCHIDLIKEYIGAD